MKSFIFDGIKIVDKSREYGDTDYNMYGTFTVSESDIVRAIEVGREINNNLYGITFGGDASQFVWGEMRIGFKLLYKHVPRDEQCLRVNVKYEKFENGFFLEYIKKVHRCNTGHGDIINAIGKFNRGSY